MGLYHTDDIHYAASVLLSLVVHWDWKREYISSIEGVSFIELHTTINLYYIFSLIEQNKISCLIKLKELLLLQNIEQQKIVIIFNSMSA